MRSKKSVTNRLLFFPFIPRITEYAHPCLFHQQGMVQIEMDFFLIPPAVKQAIFSHISPTITIVIVIVIVGEIWTIPLGC